MNIPTRPFASLDELHSSELAWLEKMAHSGIAIAVAGALRYCEKHQRTIPTWLGISAADLLCSGFKREKAENRGRASGPLARSRQDMIDYARWDEVMTIREKQMAVQEETRKLRSVAGAPKGLLAEHEKLLEWIGVSLNRAFECASLTLEGSLAFGGPEAVKQSYFKVRGNQKNPADALRYHLLDREVRESLGLIVHLPQRPGNRPKPVYEMK